MQGKQFLWTSVYRVKTLESTKAPTVPARNGGAYRVRGESSLLGPPIISSESA